ncbi:AAA family ATPase [Leisingera sp. HS039]|uniref:AAA family ATPase n=1 Tax=Leisingera sp. HS039 TaxID=2818496 RepID=UPI001B3A5651|nr:AAA family ATPase [Leisingera sp. HS039]MBQ4826975.1 AAA family ATPase [Leisingera sp. HS039]
MSGRKRTQLLFGHRGNQTAGRQEATNIEVNIVKAKQDTNSNDGMPAPTFRGCQPVRVNEFKPDLNRPYIVKGLLLAGQVGMFAGPSNKGKSSISAGVAAHVAMGRDVGETRVNRSAVIYVAAEDAEGISERAYPFMSNAPAGSAPFEVFDLALDFKDKDQIADFAEYATASRVRWGCERLLIIIDTYNLSIGDGDENSARDTSLVVGNAQWLAKTTGAHVLFIHHVGTNDNGRPRGSSAMTANVDTLLTLQPAEGAGSENVVFVVQNKQRRIPKGAPIAFRIEPYEVGFDADGDKVTVPMAVPFSPGSSLVPKQPQKRGGTSKEAAGNERAEDILRVLRDLRAADGGKWHTPTAIRDLAGTPFNDARRRSADALRKAVKRALDALKDGGKIEANAQGGYRFASSNTLPDATDCHGTLH